MLLVLCSVLILSACATPPNIPACVSFPAEKYPALIQKFYKLCADDAACSVTLDAWKEEISHWTMPTDSGFCIKIVDHSEFTVDRDTNWPNSDEKWTDVAPASVMISAGYWAKLKTWIESGCHNSGSCSDGVGDWESAIMRMDQRVKKSLLMNEKLRTNF